TGFAIGEGCRNAAAARIVIDWTQRDGIEVSATPAGECHLVIGPAVKTFAPERDPPRSVELPRHIAIPEEAVIGSGERAGPHAIPIRAAPPFGHVAANIGRDIDSRAVAVQRTAIEVESPDQP